jgi:uncharacterized YccA/Bax inhibitor family protein
MTLSGTINKAAILLAILLIGAGWVWNLYFVSHAIDDVMIYLAVGAIGGFVVALVTIFNKPISPYTSPMYAILEGFAIGAVSALYEASAPALPCKRSASPWTRLPACWPPIASRSLR